MRTTTAPRQRALGPEGGREPEGRLGIAACGGGVVHDDSTHPIGLEALRRRKGLLLASQLLTLGVPFLVRHLHGLDLPRPDFQGLD